MSTTEQTQERTVEQAIEDISEQIERELTKLADAPWLSRLESDQRAQGRLLKLRAAERDVDAAMAQARKEKNLLYRADGQPRWSPVEMAEQERRIMAPVQAAADQARLLAEQAEQEAAQHLVGVEHLDVMELLSAADLARANLLREFVREALDDPAVPIQTILARVEGALRQGDRPVLALYARYGGARGLPVAKLTGAAAPEREADRRRQEELRSAAIGVRVKAGQAVAIVQHGSLEESIRARMLSSGQYIGRF